MISKHDVRKKERKSHMKKILLVVTTLLIIASLAGCGKTKILHCDGCNAEIEVAENSDITEDWILYCSTCEDDIFTNNASVN